MTEPKEIDEIIQKKMSQKEFMPKNEPEAEPSLRTIKVWVKIYLCFFTYVAIKVLALIW